MQDAVGVQVLHGTGDGGEDLRGLSRGERSGPEPGGEIGAGNEIHREVELTVALAGVVDGDDPRVTDAACQPGLGEEPAALLGRRVDARREQLEGHVAAQIGVSGAVDHAHAAAAELRADDERTEPPAGQ